MIDVHILLSVLWLVESSGNLHPPDGKAGEVGPYQIRQCYLDDVNNEYGTRLTLDDCRKMTAARWVTLRYLEKYDALSSYEKACRVHNGGPRGHEKACTLPYWNRCKTFLRAEGVDVCTCGEQKVRLHVNGDPVHMACPAAMRDLVAGKKNEVCQ